MKEELLSIGKMAKLNRVSIPTLRLYDEMGLLKPRYIDPDSGYRYYDIHQNARLDMIAYMKELGMSLSEIADAFQKEDLDMIESLLVQKSEQIHEQMRQLKARHDAVDRAIMSIERYRKSPSTELDNKISSIQEETIITRTGTSETWSRVTYQGQTGYILNSQLKIYEEPSNPEIPTEETTEQ